MYVHEIIQEESLISETSKKRQSFAIFFKIIYDSIQFNLQNYFRAITTNTNLYILERENLLFFFLTGRKLFPNRDYFKIARKFLAEKDKNIARKKRRLQDTFDFIAI